MTPTSLLKEISPRPEAPYGRIVNRIGQDICHVAEVEHDSLPSEFNIPVSDHAQFFEVMDPDSFMESHPYAIAIVKGLEDDEPQMDLLIAGTHQIGADGDHEDNPLMGSKYTARNALRMVMKLADVKPDVEIVHIESANVISENGLALPESFVERIFEHSEPSPSSSDDAGYELRLVA